MNAIIVTYRQSNNELNKITVDSGSIQGFHIEWSIEKHSRNEQG